MDYNAKKDVIQGYEIKRSILFDNNRGVALAENPKAAQPFVTWMFTEDDSGKREYEWGHYYSNGDRAIADYNTRVFAYVKDFGVREKTYEKEDYKYYSTQRPVDIGTFPKTDSGPVQIINFDQRESVEHGLFRAWGYLIYHAPLTEKQMSDYELRPALGNPDRKKLEAQAQVIGKWEQANHIPDTRRLTWWYPDFGVYVPKEFVTPAKLSECYDKVLAHQARSGQSRDEKRSIAQQLKDGERQAERSGTPPEKKESHSHEDR